MNSFEQFILRQRPYGETPGCLEPAMRVLNPHSKHMRVVCGKHQNTLPVFASTDPLQESSRYNGEAREGAPDEGGLRTSSSERADTQSVSRDGQSFDDGGESFSEWLNARGDALAEPESFSEYLAQRGDSI